MRTVDASTFLFLFTIFYHTVHCHFTILLKSAFSYSEDHSTHQEPPHTRVFLSTFDLKLKQHDTVSQLGIAIKLKGNNVFTTTT